VCSSPLSFLGGLDAASGEILDSDCESKGESVSGKVLCFPYGKGSTVGSYAMYQLKLNGMAPAAIVNSSAEPIIATGAIIADIPMVDGVDISLLRSGDYTRVDADQGVVELVNVAEKDVVTCILRNGGKILLLKRSGKVGSYRGQWAGVSGYMESGEDDVTSALRELSEETGRTSIRPTKRLEPECFRDSDVVWRVHPFLFDVPSREITIDWEHEAFEWVSPEDLSRYPTVPGLQTVVGKLLERRKRKAD